MSDDGLCPFCHCEASASDPKNCKTVESALNCSWLDQAGKARLSHRALVVAAHAVIEADARGQGLPFAEAMDALHAALAKATETLT